VLYSGTVAAAIEGRFLGVPAIAFSLANKNHTATPTYHYETAGAVAVRIVKYLRKQSLPASTILNVNVPNVPEQALAGFQITRLGTRHLAARTVSQVDPRGHTVYWVGPAGEEQDAGPGTDFHAISTNHVSITPLKVDLTHYQAFESLSAWVRGL
jgi:5'-nucleotidase